MSKYLAVYGKPRYLGLVEYDGEIKKCTRIIVESVRGEELAVVVGAVTAEQEAEYRLLRNTSEHGDGMAKSSEPVVTDLSFIALASEEDIEVAESYREEEKNILVEGKNLLKPHNLDMKLIDVEFLRARRKLFFYFSSEQRVDFRAYVRDLAREFRTRIELRQVGVRDEAKIIRGVGPCGQPCCCSYWLNQFSPICIKMVKEQNLALNPAKISGICGRLMCCMCYEYEVYHEAWQGFPNPGTKIKTPNGNVIVSGMDLPTKSLRCFIVGKGEVKVPHDRFEEFKETVTSGGEWVTPEPEAEEPPFKMPELFSNISRNLNKGASGGSDERGAQPKGEEHSSEPRRRKKRKKHSQRREAQPEHEEQAEIRELSLGQSSDIRGDMENKNQERPRRHSPRRRKQSPAKNEAESRAAQ
ncbi:MAG: regulatory iron-sulfur-containing complex subunit RicT [Synergistaceae bacterium]|nr:regulatory iron-sulfur-containing complex subunit RicT [Synergistaceae bacterium]